MTMWFCDSLLTTGNNDGTSFDDAWQSIKTALENTVMANGDKLWIRRRSKYENPTSVIWYKVYGSLSNPKYVIGCPRNTKQGTGNFVNGSNVVDGISFTPKFEAHCGRRMKNDSEDKLYLITAIAHKIDYDNKSGVFTEGLMVTSSGTGVGKIHRVIDNGETGTLWIVVKSGVFLDDETITDEDTGSATVNGDGSDDGFIIDRPYSGSTGTGENLTIEKDEDYDLFQTIDDSGWTIKKADWNGDADDVPKIDFGTTNYCLETVYTMKSILKNIFFKGGSSSSGTISLSGPKWALFVNCLFSPNQDKSCFGGSSYKVPLFFVGCIFKGNGSYIASARLDFYFKDCAIYNFYSLLGYCPMFLENINIGVELPNSYYDLSSVEAKIVGKDVKLGGKNGYFQLNPGDYQGRNLHLVSIENWQKNHNVHKIWYPYGEITKYDVNDSSDPKKRTGGGDSIIEVLGISSQYYAPAYDDQKMRIFEHEFEVGTEQRSYRYYVQCKGMNTNPGELFLEAEFVDKFEAENKYHYKTVKSDESCAERSGDSDWSQFIEVTGIQPAIASKVRVKCYFSKYSATGKVYVDPEVEIGE